ncbi:phosphonate ABC transporter, permease protein PhnE [Brevibacterium album]|uniref:phosphonate ABC transporter, permease protein PhnE n=1 Tax=Brevibacterium album TaxID=417948 RepID=UPI000426A754|nr:phosphonate ABC transporter, permease protein PhnE [Brevibacterium album]
MTAQLTPRADGRPDSGRIRRPPDPRRRRLASIAAVIAALFLVAVWQTGFTPWALFGRMDAIGNLLGRMLPPSFVDWPRYVSAVAETLWMVIAGTSIALVLAVPVSVLAARNTTTGPIAYNVCRFIITVTRAVPSLVLALIFVRAMGIGPAAGVLAMGISSVGMIGKFFSDRIEEIDMGLVEAVRASGAGRLQVFTAAVLPQVLTNWISLALYRLDINLRNSVVLGFVGAGGIGLELQRVQGQLVYSRVLAIALIILVLVIITERISLLARRAIQDEDTPRENPFSLRARLRAHRQKRKGTSAAESEAGSGTVKTEVSAKARTATPDQPARISVGWYAGRIRRWTMALLAIAAVISSFAILQFGPIRLITAIGDIVPYVAAMFPPDFVSNFGRHLDLLLETIWMAIAATVLGMLISLPIGILGARNATVHRHAAAVARTLTMLVRGMPDMVIAIIFVAAVGLGPLAGVMALTIGSIGMAGKLIADAIEDTDLEGQGEAMKASGTTWLQRTFTSTIPTTMPAIVGVGLFMFDVFIRAATIIGIVGAGGIGLALEGSFRSRDLDQTLALVIMIFLIIYGTEKLSAWIRRQIL